MLSGATSAWWSSWMAGATTVRRLSSNRDRRKEFELRAAGFVVVRYSEEQLVKTPELVLGCAACSASSTLRLNPAPSA